MTLFFIYAIIGKLLIYLGQKFPLLYNSSFRIIREMTNCDLCFGWWIYLILSYFMEVYLLSDLLPYVFLISEVITASVTTFLVHLVYWGWKTKFDAIVVE